MSKSATSTASILFLLDPPEVLRREVMRAVTDGDREVRYDRAAKPGVANLLDILAACVDDSPTVLARLFAAEPEVVIEILRDGAERARRRARGTLTRAREAVGLLAPAAVG